MAENTEGSVWGASATIVGAILGWVSVDSAKEAVVLAAIGAVVGFVTTNIMKLATARIRSWWQNRKG